MKSFAFDFWPGVRTVRLDGGRVAEAEDDGNRAEGRAEAGSGPVGRAGGVDRRPAHLLVGDGEAGHRVGELHRGYAVLPEEAAPAERGERGGELTDRQRAAGGEVEAVDRGRHLDEVGRALGQGRRPGGVGGAVGVDGPELLALDR